MRPLFEASSVNPEVKDLTRINDIVSKSGGNVAKATKLAQQMAKAIKDPAKMARRHQAAVQILGENHPVTKAFEVAKPSEPAPKTGKPALEFIKDLNPTIYNNIIAAFKVKKLDFTKVDASKIQKLDSKTAFKYGGVEGDKYFKIWMVDDEIAFCTWANTMIDNRFNWKHRGKGLEKRVYANIIGTQPHIDGYFKSNSYLNKITTVYMIPFTAFGPAAVDMVEDERAKFFNTKNVLDDEPMIFNQVLMLNNAKAYMNKILGAAEKALNAIDKNVQVNNLTVFKLLVSGSDTYFAGEYYSISPAIVHSWWFALSLPSFDYTKYDWEGHTHSEHASYDTAKAELRKAGVKMTFETDCKKHIHEWIGKAKKLPEMSEFLEVAASYKQLLVAYNSDELVKELKGSVTNILKKVGLEGKDYTSLHQRETGFEFYITDTDRNVYIHPRTYGVNKQALAKAVKALAAKYPQYFELVKQDGTIVPSLRMKPEMLKTIEKIKK